MFMTLEEYFYQNVQLVTLVENLAINMEQFGADLTRDDRADLMRYNLVIIQQCLEGLGFQ